MSTEREALVIDDGPCELDLFVLGLARRQPVTFKVEGKEISVIINGISAEDGSAKSWIIHGYVTGNSFIPKLPSGKNFNGYFDYRFNRRGWIKPV